MSRNALVLEKSVSRPHPAPQLQPVPHSGEFLDLVRRLFHTRMVLSVIGAGSGSRSDEACRGIAAELAAGGHRVVIVQVDAVLNAAPLPPFPGAIPGRVPNVWLWPSAAEPSPVQPPGSDWLTHLRREYDAVILDCPPLDSAPSVPEIAALGDAAVLVIESGRTTREQIRRDQRMLQLRAVKLAGCIMMQKR
jgi:hypothetical protein